MTFKKIVLCLPFFVCLLSDSYADKNPLKDILKNDMISEGTLKKKKSLVKKNSKRTTSSGMIDQGELDRFVKKLWLIRNNAVLKWDKKLPDYGLEDTVEKVFKTYGTKSFSYKILFINSNTITHHMIKLDDQDFIFIISKIFAEQLDLTKQEIAVLLLESFIRANSEELSKQAVQGFKFNKDKDLKKSLNDYVEKRIQKIDFEIFNFKSNFAIEEKVIKRLFNGLSSNKKYLKTYKKLMTKVDNLLKSDIRFKFFASRYPAPEIKINWLDGMNVK